MRKTLVQAILAAFCAIPCNLSALGGGGMNIASRIGCWAGVGVPTARDYVQDGLIAMWDGIENAGWGVHDPNATVWKDLIGDHDAAFSRGHDGDGLNPDGYWANNAYVYPNSCSTASFDANLGNSLCLQFVFSERRELSVYWAFYDTYDDSCAFWFADNKWMQRIYGVRGNFDNSSLKSLIGANGCVTHYFNENISGLKSQVGEISQKFSIGNAEIKKWCIGGPFVTNYFTGKMHCVRFYNRKLSNAEFAYNYAIDKARFNLP